MTWIKPSFLWMMYRSGWAKKDANQNRILAIDLSREGFEWALANSCASRAHPDLSAEAWNALKASQPVRIQWDPERDLSLNPLAHRTIQIGIGGDAVDRYVDSWIKAIEDVTPLAHTVHSLVEGGTGAEATALLPRETPYEPGVEVPGEMALP